MHSLNIIFRQESGRVKTSLAIALSSGVSSIDDVSWIIAVLVVVVTSEEGLDVSVIVSALRSVIP